MISLYPIPIFTSNISSRNSMDGPLHSHALREVVVRYMILSF